MKTNSVLDFHPPRPEQLPLKRRCALTAREAVGFDHLQPLGECQNDRHPVPRDVVAYLDHGIIRNWRFRRPLAGTCRKMDGYGRGFVALGATMIASPDHAPIFIIPPYRHPGPRAAYLAALPNSRDRTTVWPQINPYGVMLEPPIAASSVARHRSRSTHWPASHSASTRRSGSPFSACNRSATNRRASSAARTSQVAGRR